MRKVKYIISSCVVLTMIGFFSVVRSQTTTSTIEGTVTDPNGAVVSGATVKASGASLAAERSVVTDSDGFYRLVALPAGTYKVTVSRSGFNTAAYSVELTVNRTGVLIRLSVNKEIVIAASFAEDRIGIIAGGLPVDGYPGDKLKQIQVFAPIYRQILYLRRSYRRTGG